MSAHGPMPKSAWIFPALSVVLFAVATAAHYNFTPSPFGLVFAAVLLVILFGTVFAAVHHAEMIAHRIGEPFGTLLLTLSVTIIELALITTIMLGEKEVPTLARDTVFAVVMIVCNGLVGICVFIGGVQYREQGYQVSGANLYLSVLFTMATITEVMPDYTLTTPGPIYSAAQLAFVSVVTIFLYGVFLYTQTIRHRDYFVTEDAGFTEDAEPISMARLGLDFALLLISLLGVILLAKSVAAVAAARKNELQKSINLALGSSVATIGLTIPAVAVAAYLLDKQLVLGLNQQNIVLLLLTFVLSMLTFGTGRTNMLFGLVHLVVFAVFVFMVFVP